MIECHECGNKVSTEAHACMACGAPPIKNKNNPKHQEDAKKYVNFESATYITNCESCGNLYSTRGRTLHKKGSIKCPHPGCGLITPTRNLSIHGDDSEIIVYSLLKDFFSYSGRISIAHFWISFLISIPALFAVFSFFVYNLEIAALYPILVFIIIHPLWVKRYHDLGMNSHWVIIQAAFFCVLFSGIHDYNQDQQNFEIIPIIIISKFFIFLAFLVTSVFLFLIPGGKKTNRYGPPSSKTKITWL